MNNLLSSMLIKQIDLILEGYNVDDHGNLVEVNKKKVVESDELFHEYFVNSMNRIFKQINENDPVMGVHDNSAHTMAGMSDMHDDANMNKPMQGHADHGGTHMGMEDHMSGDQSPFGHAEDAPGETHVGMGDNPGHMDDYSWMKEDVNGLDIDSFFNLTEEEDEHEEKDCDLEEEHKEIEDECELNEFDDGIHDEDEMEQGELGDASMDTEGGHNDFGGDMGGLAMDHHHQDSFGDDLDLDSSLDHQDGDQSEYGDEGDGDDVMTIHGTTDDGGDFEFTFDKDTLGFGDDESMDDLSGEESATEESEPDEFDGEDDQGMGMDDDTGMGGDQMDDMNHTMDQPGMGDTDDDEHNTHAFESKKPRSKKSTSKMDIVPKNPKSKNAKPMFTK